ncbi:hypothetical protein BH23ACT6_BH23ACT6_04810 [soil metagenome]
MIEPRTSRFRGWWRVGLGLAWAAVSGWSWLTRGETLLAGHPAHPVTLAVAGVVGLILIVLGVRDVRRGSTRRRRRWLAVTMALLGGLISVVVLGSLVFLRPFAATPEAIEAMTGSPEVTVTDSAIRITLQPSADSDAAPSTGLIFQPGARVDPRAYVPLLRDVAAQGYLVVIMKQPFGIGFTALDAPSSVIEDHRDIDRWALAGHSLGGVAASSFTGENAADVDRLLLWASYPLGSLADTKLQVTSISGWQRWAFHPAGHRGQPRRPARDGTVCDDR